MGNCMMMESSRVVEAAEDEKLHDGSPRTKAQEMEKKRSAAVAPSAPHAGGGDKLNVHGHGPGPGRGDDQYYRSSTSKEGVVRIRVVMSQRELNHILRTHNIKKFSNNNYNNSEKFSTSVDQFLNAFKLVRRNSGRVVHYADHALVETSREEEESASGWRPSLESIPEDH
ncbi:uncharacterized protein LOC131149021 [Malania oleifera]|uniref:uncharacterized protein LOC131149021 n=1 Tax=Malania oleifera TaxID=397392 RepID=UPI0025AE77FB|nr:uncharacterized protein LOC131149021 [Malania oleifera]